MGSVCVTLDQVYKYFYNHSIVFLGMNDMLNVDLQCSHHGRWCIAVHNTLMLSLSVAALVLLGVLWKSYSLPACSSIIATKGHLSCVEHFTCKVFFRQVLVRPNVLVMLKFLQIVNHPILSLPM